MTFTHRLNLMAFGLFTWAVAMFTGADPATPEVVVSCATMMVGLGAGCFATALLPGRMARFS